MKKFVPVLALTLLVCGQPANAAADTTPEAAIGALGHLNGIALACGQPALVSRARNAVTTTVPKTRDYGEIFEKATSAAFLGQGKGQTPCPEAATLSRDITAAEQRLQAAFQAQAAR